MDTVKISYVDRKTNGNNELKKRTQLEVKISKICHFISTFSNEMIMLIMKIL